MGGFIMSINKIDCGYKIPITYTPNKNLSKNTAANTKAPNTDVFTITDEGKDSVKNKAIEKSGNIFSEKQQDSASSMLAQLEAFRKQMEESDEKSAKSISDVSKAMKISRRILNGDKVPLKDMKFLAEKFPDLYKNALMFRKQNPEPKKYKSCLDDDDEKSEDGSVSESEQSDDNASFLAEALEDLGE